MSNQTEKNEKEIRNLSDFIKYIRNSRRAMLCTAVCGVVALLLAVFLIAYGYASSYNNVLPGVSVNGIDVGGLSREAARAKLENQFVKPLVERRVVLKCGDNSRELTFLELGAVADAEKLANQAFEEGRKKGNVGKTFSMMGSGIFGRKLVGNIEFNLDTLEGYITELSAEYETPMIESGYKVEGSTLTISRGEGGRRVDRQKAQDAIRQAMSDPQIKEVILTVEDATPKAINIDELYGQLTQSARNAEYRLENGAVIVVDDVPQVIVDKSVIENALKSDQKTISVEVQAVRAEKTAEQLREMLFRDVIGKWSSSYSTSSASRATNVELTADRINGYILMPGDVFSYDETVGPRTAANGYKEAGVYVGNKVESGIGGGICQTSSTLYAAALYANLEIVERQSHSLPVAYMPGGMDATIAQGYIDLKIKNSTEYPVKIVARYENRKLVCEILGVQVPGQTVEVFNNQTAWYSPGVEKIISDEIPQGHKRVVSNGAGGYSVASKRVVKMNGEVVKEEKLTNSVYRATNTEIEVNPVDTDTPPEALAVYTGKEEIQPPVEDPQKPGEGEAELPTAGNAPVEENPVTEPENPSSEEQTSEPVKPEESEAPDVVDVPTENEEVPVVTVE